MVILFFFFMLTTSLMIYLENILNLVLTNTKIIVLVGTLLFYYYLEKKYIKNIFTMLKIVIHSTILTGVVFTAIPSTKVNFLIFYLLMQILICIHIVNKNVSLSVIFRNIMILFFLFKNSILTFLFQLNVVDNLIIYDLVIKKKTYLQLFSYSNFRQKFLNTIQSYIRAPFTPLFWIISCIITFLMIHYHIYNVSFADSNGVWEQVQNFFQYIINRITFRYDIHSLPFIVTVLTISSGLSQIWFYFQKKKKNVSKTEDEVLETSSTPTSFTGASEARGSRSISLYNWAIPYAKVRKSEAYFSQKSNGSSKSINLENGMNRTSKTYFCSKQYNTQLEKVLYQHKMLLNGYKKYLTEHTDLVNKIKRMEGDEFKRVIDYPDTLQKFQRRGPYHLIENVDEFIMYMDWHQERYYTSHLRKLVHLHRKATLWDASVQKFGCIPVYPPTKLITTPTGLQLPEGFRVVYDSASFAKSYLKPKALHDMSLRRELTPLIEEQVAGLDVIYSKYMDACYDSFILGHNMEAPSDETFKLTCYIIRNGSLTAQFRYGVEQNWSPANLHEFETIFENWKYHYMFPPILQIYPELHGVPFSLDDDKNLSKVGSMSWDEANGPDATDHCPGLLYFPSYSTPLVRELHETYTVMDQPLKRAVGSIQHLGSPTNISQDVNAVRKFITLKEVLLLFEDLL